VTVGLVQTPGVLKFGVRVKPKWGWGDFK